MQLKKGDIFKSKNTDIENGKIIRYICLKHVEESGIVISIRIAISSNKNSIKKWHINFDFGDKLILAKCDTLSNFSNKDVVVDDSLNINTHKIINEVYKYREKHREEIKEYKKALRMKKTQAKKSKVILINSSKKKTPKIELSSMRGVHDPAYKGRITIVRG
jgi:hypothetical protein